MTIFQKDWLLDLSFGRMGTYHGTQDSSTSDNIDVKFVPFGSMKVCFIRDVIVGSLIDVPKFDDRVPRSLKVLISGEFGKAPLLDNYIREKDPSSIKAIDGLRRKTAIAVGVAETQKRIAQRGQAASTANYLRELTAIRKRLQPKTTPFGGGKLGKRYPGGDEEEW